MLFVVTQLLAFLSAPEAQKEARTRPGTVEMKPPEGWTPVGSIPDECYSPESQMWRICDSYWEQYMAAAMAYHGEHSLEDHHEEEEHED